MTDQAGDDAVLHRQFGVRLNNSTWDILSDSSVGPDSDQRTKDEFLYGAFACLYHWMQVGDEANRARGEHLISRAATHIGDAATGVAHAQKCLDVCKASPDVVEDWDFAFAYEALARATAAGRDHDLAGTYYAEALARGEAVADPDDRQVFLDTLTAGPWFGLR